MALKYPLMLEIGLPLAIILLVLFHIVKRKHEYKGGVRVANASYARKLPGYRKKRIFNLVVTIVLEANSGSKPYFFLPSCRSSLRN